MTEFVLDVVAIDMEKQHVAQEMKEAAVEKHVGDESERARLVGMEGVGLHDRPGVGLEIDAKKDQNVDRDQQVVDYGRADSLVIVGIGDEHSWRFYRVPHPWRSPPLEKGLLPSHQTAFSLNGETTPLS